jgi:xylose isomerase
MGQFLGTYSAGKAKALKKTEFDRIGLGQRGLPYERLDQLTFEVLLGVR